MTTFSQCRSHNGKFNLKLEYSEENKPSKLFVEVVSPKNESVTVEDLTDAIYNCFVGGLNSFNLSQKTDDLPCEVIGGFECRNIKVSWFNSYDKLLGDIASQISI